MDEDDAPIEDIADDGVEVEVENNEEEVVVEDNPNVAAQLEKTASDEGISDDETKEKKLTPEEIYNKFVEEHPEVQEIHGKKTAKRIDKLTYKQREAERQRDEAIAFAQRQQDELKKLKEAQTSQDGAFIGEHKRRLETELEAAQQTYANAYNLNDAQAMAEATTRIGRLGSQLDTAVQTETRMKRAQATPAQEQPRFDPRPKPAAKPVDPRAKAWAEENEWFGEDDEMTKSALTIHKRLVTQDGYLPHTNAYYNELNTRMRKNYPESEHFKQSETETKPALKTPETAVTPSPHNTGQAKKTGRVHLTASQVRVAKRLGVPLTEYAKSLEAYNKEH
jgi:hypothetical protein